MASLHIHEYAGVDDPSIIDLVLRATEGFLDHLLHSPNSKAKFTERHRAILLRGWNEFRADLAKVRGSLRRLSAAAHRRLYNAGMAGRQLRMKVELFLEDIQSASIGRILKRCDLILDSLKTAFPLLEAVKEYKEHVEASIENQNDPDSALNTRFKAFLVEPSFS